MEQMSKFKMIAWNSRSLKSNLSEFKLQLYTEKPHVACISETWSQHNKEPSFINYRTLWKHREEGRGGGLACLVRNDVALLPDQLETYPDGNLEVQWLTIMTSTGKLRILNTYNPCKTIAKEEFRFYIQRLTGSSIFVGDFNAHHQLWDTRSGNDINGNNLVETLLDYPSITLLTPQSMPTYVNARTGYPSTLDLCFVSSHLYPASTIALGRDCGSDHATTIIKMHINPNTLVFKTRERWNFKSGSWSDWERALPLIDTMPIIDTQNAYDRFCENINIACNKTFKMNKTFINPRFSKPWWSDSCSEALKQKNKAKNILKKHPTLENVINLNRSTAILKRIIKEQKQKSWQQYCSKINSSTPVSEVWKQVGRLKSTYKRVNTPLILPDKILTTATEKAEEFASKFSLSVNTVSPATNPLPLLLPLSLALCDTHNEEYNEPFTETELKQVISKLKHSSAGKDKIHNQIIKKLPSLYIKELLAIYNHSFEHHKCPEQWREAMVVPVLKQGKPSNDSASYRPISLLPCLAKTMEKLVVSRLEYVLETGKKFRSSQGGFRKKLSTLDQISLLETEIKTSLCTKQICITVFFDLTQAYDKVWHAGVLYKLVKLGIRGHMLGWIREYLAGRSFSVFYEGESSVRRKATCGLPQGSSLSPLLFNVMTSDLPSFQGVTTMEYADDFAFCIQGRNLQDITRIMQEAVDEFYEWTKKWGLEINQAKTKCMMFTLKKLEEPTLKLNNYKIEFVKKYRYLGMILDAPKLNWRNHVDNLRNRCMGRMNILSSVSHHKWGADRKTLSSLYIALIRSTLDYGSIFYGSANKGDLKKLDAIQNRCLRIIAGARKTSPIMSLEAETNIPPLEIHRKKLLLKFHCSYTVIYLAAHRRN